MQQKYTKTPQYTRHSSDEDILNVLVCQIKTWEVTAPNWFETPSNYTLITEVEEIEINDSFKELINEALIKLPKGAIINDTIVNKNQDDAVKTGNMTDQSSETKLSEATRLGELLTIADMINDDGQNTLMIDGDKSDTGLAPKSKDKQRVASKNDFKIGNRIEIYLGYIHQPPTGPDIITENMQKIRSGQAVDGLYLMFTGFITGISASSPIEIACENMASILKKRSSRKGIYKGKYTVNDFLLSKADGGKFGLLDDTGLQLAQNNKEDNITLVDFEISDNLSVYDMIHSWSKGNLFSTMSKDGKYLRVGYFTINSEWSSDKKRIDYTDNKSIEYIQSDWDVVYDDLQIRRVDKEYMVVQAKAKVRNPAQKDSSTKDFRVLVGKVDGEFRYEQHSLARKGQKIKKGQSNQPEVISKFDKGKYFIVNHQPYDGIETIDDLIRDAEIFWDNYNPNSISGALTIFGDLRVSSAQVIGYINTWAPEKNGIYLIESVKTTFGINGYRQTLKIAGKLSDFDKPIKIIE